MSDHAASAGQVTEVTPTEAVAMIDAGAVLLDVREPDEVAQGHAESFIAIPLSVLGERADELATDRTLVVVCRSGVRSAAASQALADAGYLAVNLAGGMEAWRDSGLPVVRDNGMPGVVA